MFFAMFAMHTPRSRRRFVVVAIVIWATTIPFLRLIVPPQPRLTIVPAGPFSLIGFSDNQQVFSGCTLYDADRQLSSLSGEVQCWDLRTGRQQSLYLLGKAQAMPAAELPGKFR